MAGFGLIYLCISMLCLFEVCIFQMGGCFGSLDLFVCLLSPKPIPPPILTTSVPPKPAVRLVLGFYLLYKWVSVFK